MGKTLTTYVNEAVKGRDVRLVDMEEIVYPDGKVVKIADVEEKFHTSCMYNFSSPFLLFHIFQHTHFSLRQ